MREAPFLGLPKARESLNAPLLTVDLHASSLWSPTSNLNQPAWHHKSFSQWTARSNFTTESAGLTERPEPEIQNSGKRYISITIIFSSRSNDFPLGLSMRVNVLVACVKTICACCERASTAFFARHERTRRERERARRERGKRLSLCSTRSRSRGPSSWQTADLQPHWLLHLNKPQTVPKRAKSEGEQEEREVLQ